MVRVLPLLGLGVVALVVWAGGWSGTLSWASLAHHQQGLAAWVAVHPLLAAAGYVLAYAAAVTLSVPAGSLFTATGGLLFGMLAGTGLAVLAATAGATLLFLAMQSALGEALTQRGGPRSEALRLRLRQDGFRYLLAIRLVPLFPFWLVNLAAALCGMRLHTYVAATALGILPVTAVLAWTGVGIGGILAVGGQPDLGVIVSLPVLGPLLALAALALLPLLWRRGTIDA
ncbi:MAG: VTT domain-containing protein [Acetobacteraceae bacterium]|nr:VTT domain-containing protein [Acetobacteraceae bacterium]